MTKHNHGNSIEQATCWALADAQTAVARDMARINRIRPDGTLGFALLGADFRALAGAYCTLQHAIDHQVGRQPQEDGGEK